MEDYQELHAGSENSVVLIENPMFPCSLSASVIDEEIVYFVENDGKLAEFKDYPQAHKHYIRISFEKANNGAKTAVSV